MNSDHLNIDEILEQAKKGEHVDEANVRKLCEKAKEILAK